jgi:hypothetical protein
VVADKITAVMCWICGKLIPLEDCKTDDDGHVVHEECYAETAVNEKRASTS